MISSTCYTLREYIGPSFNMNVIKALIGMRNDYSKDDKKDAINLCKEVIDNYKSGKKKKGLNGFFGKKVQQGNILVEEDVDDVVDKENDEDDRNDMNVYTLEEFLKEEEDVVCEDNKSEEEIGEWEEEKEQGVSDVVHEGVMKKKKP